MGRDSFFFFFWGDVNVSILVSESLIFIYMKIRNFVSEKTSTCTFSVRFRLFRTEIERLLGHVAFAYLLSGFISEDSKHITAAFYFKGRWTHISLKQTGLFASLPASHH